MISWRRCTRERDNRRRVVQRHQLIILRVVVANNGREPNKGTGLTGLDTAPGAWEAWRIAIVGAAGEKGHQLAEQQGKSAMTKDLRTALTFKYEEIQLACKNLGNWAPFRAPQATVLWTSLVSVIPCSTITRSRTSYLYVPLALCNTFPTYQRDQN